MPVSEFDFTALKDFVSSSRDTTLRGIAEKTGKKYSGSSSSMTSVLSHFHFLLSAWRRINPSAVSRIFPDFSTSFTRITRAPAAVFLHHQDGKYAIDADKEFESLNILMHLGKSMEKLFTRSKDEFERYRRSSENKISAEEENSMPEAFHYSTQGDFVMRSQLDAHDSRLPGTGMFDLKSRAVVSIRMNAVNYEESLGYEIRKLVGDYESFEREFFDMIRAAFLKYSLQARMGRMDGVFVAFHNVERIFGFQYFTLPEIDQTIHGQYNTNLGDKEFRFSLDLWNKVLDLVTGRFPGRSLRIHFEARDTSIPYMNIFAEPVTDEEIAAIQTRNRVKIEARQREILDLPGLESSTLEEGSKDKGTEKEDESKGEEFREEESKDAGSKKTGSKEKGSKEAGSKEKGSKENRELLGLRLIITNKVNGVFVERPTALKSTDNWTVGYEISEMTLAAAESQYSGCQNRRKKITEEKNDDVKQSAYVRKLRAISQRGRAYRDRQDKRDQERGVVVLGDSSS